MSETNERDEKNGQAEAGVAEAPPRKTPSVFRNYISFAGSAVAAAGFVSIALMLLLEFVGGDEAGSNPYIGIFTYILFPSVMGFGLVLFLLGGMWERRRRHKMAPDEIGRYPVLDLNNPRRRRSFVTVMLLLFVFLFMSAFGSYRAFEHTESVQFCGQTCHTVMKPEFTAYQAGAHARVKCVECHVGPGADWYVKSKLSGAYQLYSVSFNKYPRPIKSPVHNLRPAQQTCEQCHWPAKFFGAQLKIFNRFAYDEKNTLRQTRMLINTGGGDPATGQVAGIHWHMNIANEITYVSTDGQRQVIPWVRMKSKDGTVREFKLEGANVTPEQLAAGEQRRMDCVDCHNRPAHVYVPPDRAVNDSLNAGKLDPSLPYIKRQAVEILTRDYQTTDEAVAVLGRDLEGFYRQNYADVYAQRADAVRAAVAEVQRIYQTYNFPEMKTDWKTHPDNLSHFYYQGCFRCHDGQHVSADGSRIRNECNICHTVLDQTEGGVPVPVQDGKFQHPVNIGDLSGLSCTACHKHTRAFQHPVNLGDLSKFKCADCHSGKNWTLEGD
ncbi:MAG TPA: NapC/NirT family cytochrome c [Pyrinomonadaceae bacterium]|nr:NapC/NirT family cytochrome c [Pyrinomonadaceae bacterium]